MEDSTFSLILRSWSWQPGIMLGLGLVAIAYAYAFYDLRQRGQWELMLRQGLIKRSQPWYFAAGLITLFLALLSSIDTFSSFLFVMHMTQHVLLVMVAAPLILLGLPALFISPLLRFKRLKSILAWLTFPVIAFFLYNFVLFVTLEGECRFLEFLSYKFHY